MRTATRIFGLVLAAAMAPGVSQAAERVLGLTTDNNLVLFDSATPGATLSTSAINGLGAGETLVGIDFRPANGQLFSVATSGNLYRLLQGGGGYDATLVGNIGVSLTGQGYGLDFNPTVDRLRLIGDTDQNLRIVPDSAALLTDTNIGGGFDIVGSAYTNSFAGALSTVLYGLDAAGDQLIRSTNPNGGVYTSVGPLGISLGAADPIGFDISGRTGAAYFNSGGQFYTVSLATGAATLVGSIDGGQLVGISATGVIPEPATWALMILGFGAVGAVARRRRALPA